MKMIIMLMVLIGLIQLDAIETQDQPIKPHNHSRSVQCHYGNDLYECGAKLPSGQYCNFASCDYGVGSSCCQVVLCNNYFSCTCGNGHSTNECKN